MITVNVQPNVKIAVEDINPAGVPIVFVPRALVNTNPEPELFQSLQKPFPVMLKAVKH